MLSKNRQKLILQEVRQKEFVKLKDLVAIVGASESTVRRDLEELEEQNLLKRIHGGAQALDIKSVEQEISQKKLKNKEEKLKIARKAAELVEEGDYIYLDAGTTTFEMIKYLEGKNIIVVTNGITHIAELVKYNIKTYILGGQIKENTQAIIGRDAIEMVSKYNLNKGFFGANGISFKKGYSTTATQEAHLKTATMKICEMSYVLADDSKFERNSFTEFATIEQANIITTTDRPLIEFEKITDIIRVEE